MMMSPVIVDIVTRTVHDDSKDDLLIMTPKNVYRIFKCCPYHLWWNIFCIKGTESREVKILSILPCRSMFNSWKLYSKQYCTVGWSDLALFCDFRKATQKIGKFRRARVARAAKFSSKIAGALIMNICVWKFAESFLIHKRTIANNKIWN